MKKMFLKALFISFGLLFIPFVQTMEPRIFNPGIEAERLTGPTIDQAHITEENNPAGIVRLKINQEEAAQQKLRTPPHAETPPNPKTPGETTLIPARTTSDNELTAEDLTALKATEHHGFSHTTTSPDPDHITDLPTQLINRIRPKIVLHLKNELINLKETLTAEQVKNREMVIEFFHKTGELTEENLVKFHNIYTKLTEWKEGTQLALTPDEQKEMKLFLQSIVTAYCTNRQTTAKKL
jgi:hypothetical protein